ncbi:MAG: HAD family hydrolase [Deltaproteobacteria bacterium]|nr:HAD family hydrolase [Deltaproteobacteria bacterium]
MLKAILFDLDDTLVVEEASAQASFLAACGLAKERYGIDPEILSASVRKRARELWRTSQAFGYCLALGASSWEGLWARFLGNGPALEYLRQWAPEYRRLSWSRALSDHGISDSALADELAKAYIHERRNRHIVFPDVEDVLNGLKEAYRLALITNGLIDIQHDKIRGAGLERFFDAITVAGEIGVGKPDPKIFRASLEKLGVDPESSVMVGNSLKRDMAGARRAGIKGIWVNRIGGKAAGDVQPDVVLTDFRELPDLLL